jgi:ABC-type sugar transport system ATPase subunit
VVPTPFAVPGEPPQPAPVVLRLDRASYDDERGVARVREVTLEVRAGEIVGVAAVEGAGHHELLRLLAGRLVPTAGVVALPVDVGFVPEDRQRDALVLDASLAENVALRGAGARDGRVRWAAERARTAAILAGHDVRAEGPRARAASLSGGNQQKLVLAKWLAADCDVLLLDEPTRGVDVGAKAEIHAWIDRLASQGSAVLLISSELPELLALSSRVLVLRAGRVAGAVPRAAATQEAVMRLMTGLEGA